MNHASLLPDLDFLIERTEKIFLNFAESYNLLFRELGNSISSSSVLVESNGEKDSSFDTMQQTVQGLEEQNRFLLQEKQNNFLKIHEQDAVLFKDINTSIQYILSLKNEINLIKDDSEYMWIMALNAMTAGLKAGKAGGALPVITDEFKKNSLQAMKEMQNIIRGGELIEERLCTFKDLVEDIKADQQKLIEKFSMRLFDNFDSFNRDLQSDISISGSLIEQSKSVYSPLRDIMEEIQQQDLIRQSIEQVVFSISSAEQESISENETQSVFCDRLAFKKTILDLCGSLLDDVAATIIDNRRLFNDRSQEIQTIIEDVEKERKSYINAKSNAQAISADPFLTIDELFTDVRLLLNKQEQIQEQSNVLKKDVENIEELLENFAKLVGIYSNINLLYRIEVEKQPALHNMRDNVYEIIALTDKMKLKIDDMLAVAKKFIKITQNVTNNYNLICVNEKKFLDNFKTSIESGIEKQIELKHNLEASVKNYSLFTESFFRIFEQTRMDVASLDKLIDSIYKIKSNFDNEYITADRELKIILKQIGLEKWSVKNDKMLEVIHQFTIFRHKKRAGEIADFEVEEGSEAGVLTLF